MGMVKHCKARVTKTWLTCSLFELYKSIPPVSKNTHLLPMASVLYRRCSAYYTAR